MGFPYTKTLSPFSAKPLIRFLINIGYDINDLMNENNEKLLDGLAIGFGFQVVGVD